MNEIVPYLLLGIAALLPVFAAIIMKLIDRTEKFQKLPYMVQQTIFGVVFGALAVLGTEWGIKANGAIVNARDAAVIITGLTFGLPSGIIAGVIGGVERWFAVYWGAGTFTRIACSVSTIVAGVASGLARKFMFDDKRVYPVMSLTIGYVLETFHIAMVFYTNVNTPIEALRVVEACAIPMIIANSLSVYLASVAMDIIKAKTKGYNKIAGSRIAITMQKRFLTGILVGLVASYLFIFNLQDVIARNQRDQLLSLALEEIENDILDESNSNMLTVARLVKNDVGEMELVDIRDKYNVVEVNLVNDKGIIVESTNALFVGYDMSSGDQSKEFLCLLGDTQEYVQDYMPTSYDENLYRKYAGVKLSSGFVQIGYNYEQFQANVSNGIVDITKNRHVGREGFIFIVDQDQKIVSSPRELNLQSLQEAFDKAGKVSPNKTFMSKFMGVNYYIRFSSSEGYSVVAFVTEQEIITNRNMSLYAGFFDEIIILGIVYVIIYMLLKHRVVKKIETINGSLKKITAGDLNEKVIGTENVEFIELAEDINQTVDTMKEYISAAEKKIDEELKLAKNIQSSVLPRPYPMFAKYKEFDIAAYMGTAKEVGGDFYDFYMVEDKLNFLIADVSGKGIPAAMFMMRAKTELKTLSESEMFISDAFSSANDELCSGNTAGMFVTAWQGKIDLKTGEMWYVNAGHNHPLIKRKNGKFEYIKSRPNLVLAGMEGIPYRAESIKLEEGDIIYLYTDGVTEATNINNELYGEERLQNRLNSEELTTMESICDFVKEDLDAFVGEAPQFDDITMVCFRYNGNRQVPKVFFEGATLDDIPKVTDFVENELSKIECPMSIQMQMSIAIDEIFSNIVRYAYGPNKKGPAAVFVDVNEEERLIKVRFEDGGIPYNPLQKPDPDVTLSADDRAIGGLGIFMVKKSMDDMQYKYEHKLNILTLFKKY